MLALILTGLVACSPRSPGSRPETSETAAETSAASNSAKETACAASQPPAVPPDWEGTELHEAILDRDIERVRALADGARLSEQDNHQPTLLLAALSPMVREPGAPLPSTEARQAELDAQFEILRELLGRGADPNQQGSGTITPLHKAAGSAYPDEHTIRVLRLLIDAKADVNAQDDRGSTPLLEAARTNRPAVVELLLNHGADASLTDCEGHTALDVARSVNARAVEQVLVGAR